MRAITTRYSYRGGFKSAPVPREHLRQIMEAGLKAPSAGNSQTTSYVIVDDPELLAGLANMIPNSLPIKTAPAVLVVLVDWHDPQSDRADFGPVNYGASVENVLLAATGMGYATLWMEGWKRGEGAVAAVAALLNIPMACVPAVLIPVGIAEEPGAPREKRPFDERAGGTCTRIRGLGRGKTWHSSRDGRGEGHFLCQRRGRFRLPMARIWRPRLFPWRGIILAPWSADCLSAHLEEPLCAGISPLSAPASLA